MERFLLVIPHLFVVLIILSGFLSYLVAMLATTLLAVVLLWFRLPLPSDRSVRSILEPDNVSVIAHKGGAIDAPENTLAAIRLAKKNGAKAIELDVEYSLEDVAVVIHDSTVDRTTNGTGLVRGMRLEQLQELDASAKHPRRSEFPNEKIPTLEEAVELMLELELSIYFDVKGKAQRTAEVICGLYEKHPELYKSAVVCSFYPEIIYAVRRRNPAIVSAQTWRPDIIGRQDIHGKWRYDNSIKRRFSVVLDFLLKWSIFSWLWFLCGNSALLIHKDCVSKELVRYWAKRNIQVIVWTVNEESEKNFLEQSNKLSYITDSLLRK